MLFVKNSNELQERNERKLAEDKRMSAIIREEHKMEAKMNRRAGVNQRLEDEARAEETMRRNKEKEAQEIKAYKWDQQEKLAHELANIKREEFVDLKLRQQLRETNMELRDLEGKLKRAYVNKELAAQMEEKKLMKLYEQLELRRERELLVKIFEKNDEEVAKIKKEEHEKKLQYKKDLQAQAKSVTNEMYEQFLRDKQLMDEIIRIIQEEDMRERELKMIEMKRTREEMDLFLAAREEWRQRQKKATEEEDRRLIEYWANKDAEEERVAMEAKCAKELNEKRQQVLFDHFLDVTKDDGLRDALDELYIAQRTEELDKRNREDMEAMIRRKIEAKLINEEQQRDRAEQKKYEKKKDEEFRQELLRKFAEDARLEQMTKERRRQLMLDHRKEIEEMILERQRKRIEQEHVQRELERMEEEQIKKKHKMIEEERQKMLQEHAKNLIGYLPKGLLRPSDFPYVGLEFESKKDEPQDLSLQCK